MECCQQFTVQKIDRTAKSTGYELVVRETPLTIMLNNRELVTLLCSPEELDYLALGFLASEGLIKARQDIIRIATDEKRGISRVDIPEMKDTEETVFKRFITSGCGRGASFYSAADIDQTGVESGTTITADQVFALVREFQHRSEIYRSTGGVHSAALCEPDKILVFREDIGRHNAIDKIFGECLWKDIPTEGRIIITSGRISSEILLKVARRYIPLLISKSAPTDMGVRLAQELGVTLIGFVRGARMNVYTHDWRVKINGK